MWMLRSSTIQVREYSYGSRDIEESFGMQKGGALQRSILTYLLLPRMGPSSAWGQQASTYSKMHGAQLITPVPVCSFVKYYCSPRSCSLPDSI